MKTYIRKIGEKSEISTLQVMILVNSYPERGWSAGQYISFIGGPQLEEDLAVVAAEGWVEYIPPVIPPQPKVEPSTDEKMEAFNRMFAQEIVALDDESALVVKALFPAWIEYIGEEVTEGWRTYYDDRLWKVIQPHTIQEDWTPATAHSLYVEITIEDGSFEHPIHFNQGMILEVDKYYTQFDVKYQCIRNSKIGIWADLSTLVDNYVKVVNE